MNELHSVVEGEVVNGAALTIIPKQTATELHRHATDVANVCREIVTRTAVTIQGRKYVPVEGWQSIANAFGLVASSRDVEKVDGGIKAIGEVKRISDGAIVSTAEGFVGNDESTWASRPEYARRGMVQTRAISRACRSALAFVVVMMNEGLSTTPAEEVPLGGFNDSSKPLPAPLGVEGLKQKLSPKPMAGAIGGIMDRLEKLRAPNEPPPHTDADQHFGVDASTGEVHRPEDAPCPPYGHGKGKKLSDLDLGQLQFYESGALKSISDPSKAKYKTSNESQLAVIRSWIQFRS